MSKKTYWDKILKPTIEAMAIDMAEVVFKKGDMVEYNNGTVKERFFVYRVGENHLFSTQYNIPSYNKKYCKKL